MWLNCRRTARSRSAVGLVVEMHSEMGVPLAKVANLQRNTFSLNVMQQAVSPSVLHRADLLTPRRPTRKLCEQVQQRAGRLPARVQLARRRRASSAVAVRHGRTRRSMRSVQRHGFDQAGTVHGDRLRRRARARRVAGVPDCYKDSLHRSCINRLLRRFKALQEDHAYSPCGAEVKAVLEAVLDVAGPRPERAN